MEKDNRKTSTKLIAHCRCRKGIAEPKELIRCAQDRGLKRNEMSKETTANFLLVVGVLLSPVSLVAAVWSLNEVAVRSHRGDPGVFLWIFFLSVGAMLFGIASIVVGAIIKAVIFFRHAC